MIGVICLLAVTITVILVVAAAAAQTVYRWQRGQAAAGQQRRRRHRLPVSNDVAYYRHVLTLDRLAGYCAAVTGSRQPSTPGKRFKKLASVLLSQHTNILVQFHSNANTTLQILHI